jgi:hypothetical protein
LLSFAAADVDRTTDATTPFGIVFVFMPARRQVTCPEELVQYKLFEALAAEGPGTTLNEEMSEVG